MFYLFAISKIALTPFLLPAVIFETLLLSLVNRYLFMQHNLEAVIAKPNCYSSPIA